MTETEHSKRARTPGEVARAAFAAVQARDPGAIVAHGHPDRYVDDFVAIGIYRGKDEIRGFFREIFTAVPDLEMEVVRIISDDHSACVQWRMTGTHSGGHFLGLAPSGRRLDLKGVDVMEIEDGFIAQNTIYYDGVTFARQIGLLPREGSVMESAMKRSFNAWTRIPTRNRRTSD